jgi:thymidine kinase
VLDLVPLANKVEKLAGRCSHCGEPALFSVRVTADSRQELVGGSDKYVPACRYHYKMFSRLREQAEGGAVEGGAPQLEGGWAGAKV